ncbi:MAG: RNA methyltransferase [Gammaproteobacteria bacterium]|nr:RNA methyltransferase [Gammaproteobacteria bacterium]MCF6229508.1 RNA methyltransferase [Gammaproteobacteria bacterium]
MKLANIRIVMVETTHPGNIGACARAMKNMGLSRLHLVKPARFPDNDAFARASGASDILDQAVVSDSLAQAVEACGVVVGASARRRSIAWPEFNPRECAEFVAPYSEDVEVAIVFGRESSGLTNEELDCCSHLVHIPCNPEFSSLNVAAAIQVICYELRMQLLQGDVAQDEQAVPDRLATSEELEGMYEQMQQTLIEIDFLDADKPRKLMRRLRRLYNRTALERREVNILRGILSAAQRQARIAADNQ